MKKIAIRLLVAVYLISATLGAVHEFQVNKALDYYSIRPVRALYVLAITALVTAFGGATIFVFRRLSAPAQRTATLLGLGGIAMSLTVISGYTSSVALAVMRSMSELSSLYDGDLAFGSWTVLSLALPPGVVAVFAAGSWYLFYRVLKKRKPTVL